MSGSLELDAYCAKQRGLSYGQYMALTDERERAKLRKQYRKDFEKASAKAHAQKMKQKEDRHR